MLGKGGGDRAAFAGKATLINARAAPDPVRGRAPEQGGGKGGGGGGVANAHLPRDKKIGICIHGVPANGPSLREGCLTHRGGLGEIFGRHCPNPTPAHPAAPHRPRTVD